jgi:hypothetical protein
VGDPAKTYTFWNQIWDGIKKIPTKILDTIGSRKFLAACGATFAILEKAAGRPLTPTEVYAIAGIWLGFILGTAYEDGKRAESVKVG